MRTQNVRIFVLLALMAFAMAAQPASALCVRCIVNECWAQAPASAANCYSYATSCLTSGHCFSGGGGCEETDTCTDEDGFGVLKPLNSEYILASVAVEHPKPARMVVAYTTSSRSVVPVPFKD